MARYKNEKEEREKRNWSQNDLAEKLHVSRQSVSKWETGKNYPSIEIIIQLLSASILRHSLAIGVSKMEGVF